MDAQEFIELLNQPEKVGAKSVEELKKLSLEFPYSQPVQLLYAIRLSQSSEYLFNRQLGKTSALTSDRTVLFDMFEREEERAVQAGESNVIHEPASIVPPPPVEEEEVAEELPQAAIPEPAEEEPQPAIERPPVSAAPAKPAGLTPNQLAELSPQEKVKAILEENRRLRKQFEGTKDEDSSMNRRISEIRNRLDQIKEKQDRLSPEPQEPTSNPSDVERPALPPSPPTTETVKETISSETTPTETESIKPAYLEEPLEFQIGDDDAEYSADEEALLGLAQPEEEKSLVDEVETKQPLQPEEPLFVIEEETSVTSAPKVGAEEHSFEEWLEKIATSKVDKAPAQAPSAQIKAEELSTSDPIKEPTPAPDLEDSKEVSSKFELFDSFVEKLPELKQKRPPSINKPVLTQEDLSDEESSLVTETLAKVYLKQKHYDKAIKAYEILRLKYPEKSGFFADRIFEIKKLSNS